MINNQNQNEFENQNFNTATNVTPVTTQQDLNAYNIEINNKVGNQTQTETQAKNVNQNINQNINQNVNAKANLNTINKKEQIDDLMNYNQNESFSSEDNINLVLTKDNSNIFTKIVEFFKGLFPKKGTDWNKKIQEEQELNLENKNESNFDLIEKDIVISNKKKRNNINKNKFNQENINENQNQNIKQNIKQDQDKNIDNQEDKKQKQSILETVQSIFEPKGGISKKDKKEIIEFVTNLRKDGNIIVRCKDLKRDVFEGLIEVEDLSYFDLRLLYFELMQM